MPNYTLSSAAEADLESIYVYTIKTWGAEQFQTYRSKMNAALEAVGDNPNLIGSKNRDDILEGCRFYAVEQHFIAYRVVGDQVQIGRILHQSMDFDRHISGDVFE